MAIEFHCHICDRLLRTAEDKAGRTAKCPGCGENVTVPYPEGSGTPLDRRGHDEGEYGAGDVEDYEQEPPPNRPETAAAAATVPAERRRMKDCPICGERIPAAAVRCRFCGEDLQELDYRRGPAVPGELEFGETFSASWNIFSKEMGLLIGAVLLLTLLMALVMLAGIGVFVGVFFAAASAAGEGVLTWVAAILTGVLLYAGFVVLQSYLLAGQNILLLKVVRGEPAEISDLFSGGPYTRRMLGATLIFSTAFTLGYLACLVPGVLVALMWWPYSFLIVDENRAALDSLRRANEITDGHWGQEFLLLLVAFLIQSGANSVCPVAFIFTMPWMLTLMAVAYCRLTGQATAE